MMGVHMNGAVPQPQVLSEHTPVAYYTPIAITPASIRWLVGGTIAMVWSLIAAGVLFIPAKQTDLETLTKVVQVIQTGQADAKLAVERLTVAVDNLSGIVDGMRRLKNSAPKMKIR
jgi:hypothetical protein